MYRRLSVRTVLLLASTLLMAATAPAGPLLAQSPIDILSGQTVFSVLPPLIFNYSTNTALDVVNTGSPDEESTIRANVGAGSSLTVNGTPYNLLQFHFHSEAEHLVNGHQAAMEMHFVNQDAGGALLVVGVFIEIGGANAGLASIFSNLPQNSGDHVAVTNFNIAALLPGSLTSYRYSGSLTTPPFTEGVSWNVLSTSITMSQAQVDAFRTLFPAGNSRDVQALNGRTVLTDVVGFSTPEPGSFGLIGIGIVGLAVIRRRMRTRKCL